MKNLEKFEPIDLLNFLRNSFKKETISFIQIGVNDGKTHDMANDFLKESDVGYFIEPIESTFEIMKLNKQKFKSAKFIKKAILPEVLRGNNIINILSNDQNNEGASIGSFNKDRISSQIIVDTITIIDFLIEEIVKMEDNKKYLIVHKKLLFSGQQLPLSGKEWKLCIPEIKNPKIELI
jgi:hypothetical protein